MLRIHPERKNRDYVIIKTSARLPALGGNQILIFWVKIFMGFRTVFKISKPKIILSIILFFLCTFLFVLSEFTFDFNFYGYGLLINYIVNVIPVLSLMLFIKLNIIDSVLLILPLLIIILILWSYFLSCIVVEIISRQRKT